MNPITLHLLPRRGTIILIKKTAQTLADAQYIGKMEQKDNMAFS